MKHIRILILTGVILAALFVAVLPSLAFEPAFASWPNWSFEFDTDGNGVPNAWNFKEDNIIYVCGHPNDHMYDDCLVGFLADDDTAAIWQNIEDPIVLDEEGYLTCVMSVHAAAQSLPPNRVYGGAHLYWDTGESTTVYGPLPGGSYNFNTFNIWDTVNDPSLMGIDDPDSATWGFVALPGGGRSYIDFAALGRCIKR